MTRWTLPEDGYVDQVAIAAILAGRRDIALTPNERDVAAAALRDAGHSPTDIARRLHLSGAGVNAILSRLDQHTARRIA